jgi:type II secretory pathway pseudopilin PulG
MLVVIAIIAILAAMLSGPLMRARRQAQIVECTNNLKQLGIALTQYTTKGGKNQPPRAGDATTASAMPGVLVNWNPANLTRLFVSGNADAIDLFFCPVAKGAPSRTTAQLANHTTALQWTLNAWNFIDYNLTAGYRGTKEPGNKIVIADSPLGNSGNNDDGWVSRSWFNGTTIDTRVSIHDLHGRFREGPGMLYQDNHVKVEPDTLPKGSSMYPVVERIAAGEVPADLPSNIETFYGHAKNLGLTIYGFIPSSSSPMAVAMAAEMTHYEPRITIFGATGSGRVP